MSYEAPPPPPPPPPPGGGYGQPPYGASQPASTSVLAIVSLVLGILGIIPCCGVLVFGIGAAITGNLAKKEIASSNGLKKGAGMAQWGFILGLIGIALGVLYWIGIATGTVNASFSTN